MKSPVDPKSLTEGLTISYVEKEGDFAMVIWGTIKSVQHFSGDETEVVFTNGFTVSFFPGDTIFVSDEDGSNHVQTMTENPVKPTPASHPHLFPHFRDGHSDDSIPVDFLRNI